MTEYSSRMLSRAIGLVVFSILALAANGVARADCGAHALSAEATQLRVVEAMPLTTKNVVNDESNDAVTRWHALRSATNYPVVACPDDTPPEQQRVVWTAGVWEDAVRLQTLWALVKAFQRGETQYLTVPDQAQARACAPLFLAEARSEIAIAYGQHFEYVPQSNTEDFAPADKQAPFYSHIVGLYRRLGVEANVHLPAVGTNSYAMLNWSNSFGTRAEALRLHLPNGVYCESLPSQ